MSAKNSLDKEKSIELAISQLDKQFGRGSIMRLGDVSIGFDIPVIPTGSIGLDAALGVGGLPRGRIVEVFGPEASGKTTLSLHFLAEAQKQGGNVVFIDAEHALDAYYAKNLGIDIESLLVSQPDHGEQALEIAETLIRSNAIDMVVTDSVAALVPRAEIDGEMGDSFIGLQARLMSQAMRKLTSAINRSQCVCVFINQIREKIGVMFGSPETTPGGRALKFYSSVRLDIRRIASIKEGTNIVGNRTRVKVVKNKVAPPFKETEFDIMYGKGISTEGEIIDLSLEHKIIERTGTWFSYGSERLGQGRENAKRFLEENTDIYTNIVSQLREKLGLKAPVSE